MKEITAVNISRRKEKWELPEEANFFSFVEDVNIPKVSYPYYQSEASEAARRYVTYLAGKRNRAITNALEIYPDTEHILVIDGYYLTQVNPIKRLIDDYYKVKSIEGDCALGGATWGKLRTRLEHYVTHHKEWYDKWGVPELAYVPYGWTPEKDMVAKMFTPPIPGLYATAGLSGICIWPRSAWDKGARFGVYDDLHGCEMLHFFMQAGIPRWIDLNAAFWRQMTYPFTKCLRHTLHLGRLVGKKSKSDPYAGLLTSAGAEEMRKYKK